MDKQIKTKAKNKNTIKNKREKINKKILKTDKFVTVGGQIKFSYIAHKSSRRFSRITVKSSVAFNVN